MSRSISASRLERADVLEMGAAHVVIATGASWRRDGVGRAPLRGRCRASTATASTRPTTSWRAPCRTGPVLDLSTTTTTTWAACWPRSCARRGLEVTLVTPAESASFWTHNTLDHDRIQTRLLELDVEHRRQPQGHGVPRRPCGDGLRLYGAAVRRFPAGSVVTVTARLPDDELAARCGRSRRRSQRPASSR